jgi:hypothetical protein
VLNHCPITTILREEYELQMFKNNELRKTFVLRNNLGYHKTSNEDGGGNIH